MSWLGMLRRPRGNSGARLLLGLGAVTVWLVLAAVVGALALGGDGETEVATDLPGGATPIDPSTGLPASPDTTVIDPETGEPVTTIGGGAPGPGSTGSSGTRTPGAGTTKPGTSPGSTGTTPATGAPTSGDRTGVTQSEIKVGIHAPKTFSGVPLNLAEDPIKGVEAYVKFLNDNGGINGRKIRLTITDDRFDTPGAQAAANALINDGKNFVVSGTLGIDQIAVVAAEAARRGVPYVAGGGAENVPIPGMFQILASYTTHVEKLAAFIAKDDKLKGKRIGILVSDSQYIRPVADAFKAALESHGQTVSTIVANQKPAQNPDYNGYILQFRRNDTEVVVPLTDPLTTQQIVQRCAAGAACGWTYSFSDFAHDGDTALLLFVPTWANQRVRGLSSACYYMAPEVEGGNCAQMKTAREQYIAVHGRDDWEENGSGASFGFQIVGFLRGALSAPGADLTRERFSAALREYAGYSDLVTGAITFKGSRNLMHGAEKMTVLEAQSNNKYKMITPGFVDGF